VVSTFALDPPRAHGAPLATGVLRAEPEDFIVEEDLGFAPSGAGQHLLLKVRKRDANTQWIARELARVCGCKPLDVGFAGLKDRRAVAIQWFSVPQSRLSPAAWTDIRGDEFEVLEAHLHSRKLPRGALSGNRFAIRLRDFDVQPTDLVTRLEAIARRGVPNYFGPQRFGRDGANLQRLTAGLGNLRQPERGFVLSAARSLVFNAVLAERVADGTWEHIEIGDVANLDGRGSVFPVDAEELEVSGARSSLSERCQRLDVHPTGPLWGKGVPATTGRVLELEQRVGSRYPEACALCVDARMEQERRSLRLAVRDLAWEFDGPARLVLRFRLTKGSFATTVLRELATLDGSAEAEAE
jgi:tRNA pseudouridine13 synthase